MKDSTATPETDDTHWLSLQAATAMLGISASTLRRWAADGRVPSRRTPGGHRRFDGRAVQHLIASRSAAGAPPARPPVLPPARDESPWHARLAQGPLAAEMRGLGQRLLGLLIQYLVWRGDDSRFLADSREVGTRYGVAAGQSGVSLSETVQAFLYFRGTVWRMALQLPSIAQATDVHEIVRIAERIDRFMDGVLVSTVAGYERAVAMVGAPAATD
jgi:excisionase family DNA binding protein